MAEGLLQSEGISAHLADDYVDVKTRGLTGLRLFVPAKSLALARELLQTGVSEEDLSAQAEDGLDPLK